MQTKLNVMIIYHFKLKIVEFYSKNTDFFFIVNQL
jgi:hypothetical protein